MPRKPTGKKNGRPKKNLDLQLLDELNASTNSGRDWDNLFDLYIYFESRNASESLLAHIQKLIDNTADSEVLAVRMMVDEMEIDLNKACNFEEQYKILCLTEYQLSFRKSQEAGNVIYQIRALKLILEKPKTCRMLNRSDYDHFYENVGVDKTGEIKFILDYLDGMVSFAKANGFITLGKIKKYIPKFVNEEITLQSLVIEAFEKVLRNGTYNQFKDQNIKKGFLKKIYYSVLLDYHKLHYPISEQNKKKAA